MSKHNIYLTDRQYIGILKKIIATVNKPGFQVSRYDCNDTGYKETTTNCGLCNNDFVDKVSLALFPDEYKTIGRKNMKYPENWHKCPFDMRPHEVFQEAKQKLTMLNGCFNTCGVFRKKNRLKIDAMKTCAERTHAWAAKALGKTK